MAATERLIQHHRYTREQYHCMGAAGVLTAEDRVELIEGQIVDMPPIGSPHSGTLNHLNRLLVAVIGDAGIVSIRNPVVLGNDSEPEPDIAILRARDDFYFDATPRAEDVLLLIELSESSVRYDREVKMPLYARYGISEAWLIELAVPRVTRHTAPSPTGYVRTAPLTDLARATIPEIDITVDLRRALSHRR